MDEWTVGLAVGMVMAGLKIAELSLQSLKMSLKKKNGHPKIYSKNECPVHGNCLGSDIVETLEDQQAVAEKSEKHLSKIATDIAVVCAAQNDQKSILADIQKDTQWLRAMDEAAKRKLGGR